MLCHLDTLPQSSRKKLKLQRGTQCVWWLSQIAVHLKGILPRLMSQPKLILQGGILPPLMSPPKLILKEGTLLRLMSPPKLILKGGTLLRLMSRQKNIPLSTLRLRLFPVILDKCNYYSLILSLQCFLAPTLGAVHISAQVAIENCIAVLMKLE